MTDLRLRMREEKLQARADWHKERIKGNFDYLRSDGARIIGNDVAQNLATKSPILAKTISYITGNNNAHQEIKKGILGIFSSPRNSRSNQERINPNTLLTLDGIKTAILPTLYTLAGMKLLSYSIKGTRKLVMGGLKKLFK